MAFDLWTSPDQSLLVFAAADSYVQAREGDPEQRYQLSSIYTASKSDDFIPVLLLRGPRNIGSLKLERFHSPRFEPRGKTIYVKAGYTMTTDVILAVDLVSREVRLVGQATDFRVIWGGRYSGQLMFMLRQLPRDASTGVSYQCRIGRTPVHSRLVHSNCADFLTFTSEWAKRNGAIDR